MSKVMSSESFDTCAVALGMTDEVLAMARRVLVDGETPANVARDVGLSRQRVQSAKTKVLEIYAARGGWVKGSVVLPAGMHEELDSYGAALQARGLSNDMAVVRQLIKSKTNLLDAGRPRGE